MQYHKTLGGCGILKKYHKTLGGWWMWNSRWKGGWMWMWNSGLWTIHNKEPYNNRLPTCPPPRSHHYTRGPTAHLLALPNTTPPGQRRDTIAYRISAQMTIERLPWLFPKQSPSHKIPRSLTTPLQARPNNSPLHRPISTAPPGQLSTHLSTARCTLGKLFFPKTSSNWVPNLPA